MGIKKEFFLNLFLVFVSTSLTLLAGELIVRDYRAGFENVVLKQGNLIETFFPGLFSYDPTVGWVPTPRTSGERWGTKIHLLDDGIRSNGHLLLNNRRGRILVVGDSFTFGDEVGDHETWPSFLERFTGYRVLNAGVSSYGLDQMVLRAEQLIPKYKPDTLIISVIFDDLDRCRQSVRHGIPKPYFVVENDQLVLKNVPAPPKPQPKLDWFKSIFGYSHLANKIMERFFPYYWWEGTNQDFRYIKTDVNRVTQILFERLDKLAQERKMRVIVLVQGDINVSETRVLLFEYVLSYIRSNLKNIEICNLYPYFFVQKKANPEGFLNAFSEGVSHLSPEGNAWVAMKLKEKMFGP